MSFDFRVEAAFFGHPKTDALRSVLGDTGVVCLLRLWAYAAEYRPDGDLSGLSDEIIEEKAGWRGASGELILSLTSTSARWLDGQKLRRHLHDWRTHQPWLAGRPARKAAAKEAARIRWENSHAERIAEGNAKRNADSMRGAMPPTPQHPSKPQQAPASLNTPPGVVDSTFVTETEARETCKELGWPWPTEIKLKTLRKVQGVFPCTRDAFTAALETTKTSSPIDKVPFLAGTIANLEAKEKPQKKVNAMTEGSRLFREEMARRMGGA